MDKGQNTEWPGNCMMWVVGIIALVVLLAILMPEVPGRFVRRGKAREAQVKQNLHAIQLALERYAVDNKYEFPMFVMGGDWTDSYVASQEWVDSIAELDAGNIYKYMVDGEWLAAPRGMGDALVMEGYMPSYPGNPFVKNKSARIPPWLEHHDALGNIHQRYSGGRTGDKMAEVFGPNLLHDGQHLAGDYFVHHIFNNPPYDTEGDIRKETTDRGEVDFNSPSGNAVLVGNFSYWPRPSEYKSSLFVPADDESLLREKTVNGYTLAGYGGLRTPGQDAYNRNGNYKGRYRTEQCDTDCSAAPLFPDDIPCICPGVDPVVSHLQNNGGSDTLADGVIIILDPGTSHYHRWEMFRAAEKTRPVGEEPLVDVGGEPGAGADPSSGE